MSITKIYGLVLAGGKSQRMGEDKGNLMYHNSPQREHAYNQLNEVCDKTYFSIRAEQEEEFDSKFNVIIDQNNYRGPYNGILSAHHFYPDVAWLVLATDLPLLQTSDLIKLIKHRNVKSCATAYATLETGLPEPMIAIWEPNGLGLSEIHLNAQESTCPRKFLINNNTELVFPENDSVLMNANTITDYKKAKTYLKTN